MVVPSPLWILRNDGQGRIASTIKSRLDEVVQIVVQSHLSCISLRRLSPIDKYNHPSSAPMAGDGGDMELISATPMIHIIIHIDSEAKEFMAIRAIVVIKA